MNLPRSENLEGFSVHAEPIPMSGQQYPGTILHRLHNISELEPYYVLFVDEHSNVVNEAWFDLIEDLTYLYSIITEHVALACMMPAACVNVQGG